MKTPTSKKLQIFKKEDITQEMRKKYFKQFSRDAQYYMGKYNIRFDGNLLFDDTPDGLLNKYVAAREGGRLKKDTSDKD